MISLPDLRTPTSVVIATSGDGGLAWGEPRSFVVEAVRSVRATTAHRDLEFVVVHHSTAPDATVAALVETPDIDLVLVPFDGPLVPAALLNHGALHASGEVLVFLDERTQSKSEEMLGHLIAPLSQQSVGMAGAKLVRADGDVQHAGISVVDGRVEHPFHGMPDSVETSPDLFQDRSVDGLDAACVAVSTRLFHEVGGWSEEIPDRYRSLDLGFKIRREGHILHWSAEATLWCFASDDPGARAGRWEADFMTRRWGRGLTPTASGVPTN